MITVIENSMYKDAICDTTLIIKGQKCIGEEFLYATKVKLLSIQNTL